MELIKNILEAILAVITIILFCVGPIVLLIFFLVSWKLGFVIFFIWLIPSIIVYTILMIIA